MSRGRGRRGGSEKKQLVGPNSAAHPSGYASGPHVTLPRSYIAAPGAVCRAEQYYRAAVRTALPREAQGAGDGGRQRTRREADTQDILDSD